MEAIRYQAKVWVGGKVLSLDEAPGPVRAAIEAAVDTHGRASGAVTYEGREYRWGHLTTLDGMFPILDRRAYSDRQADSLPGWMRTPTGM